MLLIHVKHPPADLYFLVLFTGLTSETSSLPQKSEWVEIILTQEVVVTETTRTHTHTPLDWVREAPGSEGKSVSDPAGCWGPSQELVPFTLTLITTAWAGPCFRWGWSNIPPQAICLRIFNGCHHLALTWPFSPVLPKEEHKAPGTQQVLYCQELWVITSTESHSRPLWPLLTLFLKVSSW